eukprot:CAMPEP_0176350236 /NCGR_PEP_ID=MMETSP0126-20121128/9316_1 /TAXON_ID=141414 ORGANISM="Strombidinopsis acuminatum, Strain SPMC142" /NCGR_SAMPLE_ID=MMETSP0126 /ASSEMBLY_ACC=CAM_ASM_000229 /LENGTH=39 /DNA_ID= /DNA_START= /DNA_END= /DNA_ORIENTATION=
MMDVESSDKLIADTDTNPVMNTNKLSLQKNELLDSKEAN